MDEGGQREPVAVLAEAERVRRLAGARMTEEKPPSPKSGRPCLACNQRIVVFSKRLPVRDANKQVVGWRHWGCSLPKGGSA